MDKITRFGAKMQEIQCWVPNCTSSNKNQTLFSLPDNPNTREIWLALAGKPVTSLKEKICFCSEHFSVSSVLKFENNKITVLF